MWWWGNLDLRVKKWMHNQRTKHKTQRKAKLGPEPSQIPLTGKFKLFSTHFFPNGWNLCITEVKSNTLHLTVPVIHLQEINCQAFKHFSSWVIIETFINCAAGTQYFCLVFLLIDKDCSSFHVAAFIYILNNRIIIFLLPYPDGLFPVWALHVSSSAAISKQEAALDCLSSLLLSAQERWF